MADIFYNRDTIKLLENKHVVFFGDSNTRAVYKDLVVLLNENFLINQSALRQKQEQSFYGDTLGKHSELNRGRDYEEERTYKKGKTQLDFYFITRCYNPIIVDMMEDIHLGLREAPDVIYINSTLWDVSRWGPNGVVEFKDNLQKLARLLKSSLPDTTLVIWATALPIGPTVRSSILLEQIKFLQFTFRFDVMEANSFARQVMANHGFDVLDLHFHMRMQIHRRVKDGVHYLPTAVRLLTNLLLTHIALSWDFALPNRRQSRLLDKAKLAAGPEISSPAIQLESPKLLSDKQKVKNTQGKKTNVKRGKRRSGRPNQRTGPNKRTGPGRDEWKKPYQGRGPLYNSLHKPTRGKVKSLYSHQNYGMDMPGDMDRERWSPPISHSSGNASNPWNPWSVPPQNVSQIKNVNWSDDHWPEEQFCNESRFENVKEYPNEQRFQMDQSPHIDPWSQRDDGFQSSQRYQNDQRFGQRFGCEDKFQDGQLYPNEQRLHNEFPIPNRDPRFIENLRKVSNTLDAMKRHQLQSNMRSRRYNPY